MLPSTCPRQPGCHSPSKHSRAQPVSGMVAAPLACLAARKTGRSKLVQAVIPGASRDWCGSGEPLRTPGLTSCRAQSARSVQRPEQEPMVFTPPAGAFASRVGPSQLHAKASVHPHPACLALKTPPPSSLQIPPKLAAVSLVDPNPVRPLLLDPAPAHPLFRPCPPPALWVTAVPCLPPQLDTPSPCSP